MQNAEMQEAEAEHRGAGARLAEDCKPNLTRRGSQGTASPAYGDRLTR